MYIQGYKKNLLIFLVILLLFFVVTFIATQVYLTMQREALNHRPFPIMLGQLLNNMGPNPVESVKKLQNSDLGKMHRLDVIDSKGKSLINGEQIKNIQFNEEKIEKLSREGSLFLRDENYSGPIFIVKTNEADTFYFISFGKGFKPPHQMLLITVLPLLLATILSIALALYIMFSFYKKKALEAEKVLSELRSGNLKARMEFKGFDEFRPIANSFNAMAEEIEALVESLKKTDRARRQLLQDLAHDLRTPLTSMKSFLETLLSSFDRMNEDKRQSILSYCLAETDYFSSLVEDLLFLANISEPAYTTKQDRIDINDEITNLVELFKTQAPKIKINYEFNGSEDTLLIGSKKLFERLIRNALANAISFAKSSIDVKVDCNKNLIKILICDDGPGFSQEELTNFGNKKVSRKVNEAMGKSGEQRISLGIGSLIMKEIVKVHRGNICAYNKERGPETGAIVEIELPKNPLTA